MANSEKETEQGSVATTPIKPTSSKSLTIGEFLNTVSISPRHKWVVEKMYAKDVRKKTAKSWKEELRNKCEGITINS